MKKLLPILCSLVIIWAIGCSKDDNENNDSRFVTTPSVDTTADFCIRYPESSILGLTGPDVTSVNQDASFEIQFWAYNGCGSFHGFETLINNDTITVKVRAKYLRCNVCTQALRKITAIYSVRASDSGTYYLKFLKDDGTVLTKSVLVRRI